MKKLLALILCVMLFVSVIPTAAFAAGTVGGKATAGATDSTPKWSAKDVSAKAIKDLNKDLQALYGSIAADTAVFNTAKTLYNLSDGIAESLFADTEKVKGPNGYDVYKEDLVDNVRKYLNANIGNEITNYINARKSVWTDSNGYVKPEKYLDVFATAASKAVTSEKSQKAIEALAYGLAVLNLQNSVNDDADDLYKAIKEWGNDKFAEFGDAWKNIDPSTNYYTTWLPSENILIPTGSDAAKSDAASAYAALFYAVS